VPYTLTYIVFYSLSTASKLGKGENAGTDIYFDKADVDEI